MMQLGIYAFPHTYIGDSAFAEKLRRAVVARNLEDIAQSKKEVHLLVYTHGLTSGGAERQWCYLAVELAHRGYAVTLLTDTLEGEAGHYLSLLQGSSVRVLTIDTLLLPKEMAMGIPSLELPLPVYRCMAAFALLRPSHVLCQLDESNILAGAAMLLLPEGPETALFSFRNVNPSHFPYIYQPWMFSLYKILAESRNIILSGNSQHGNEDYANWLGIARNRVATINNALHIPEADSDCGENLRQRLGVAPDALVILSVFRLSPEKNPLLWLKILRRLRVRFPQLIVLHAGVGYLADSVSKKAQRYGLGDAIRFLGRRQDTLSLMRAADIFLLTSDFEGLPNVLLEAQAVGLPIVATKVGGVPEAVIEDETALLAPKGDGQTLTKHCRILLEDAELRRRMGETGKKFVSGHFSHERFGERTLDVLNLPPAPQKPFVGNFEELPAQGISIDNSYFMARLAGYLASYAEPVLVFASETAWELSLPLPPDSLRVDPGKSVYGDTSPSFVFDWANATTWQPLHGVVLGQKTAVFGTNACLNPVFRSRLRELGVQNIVYCDGGTIYRIPVIHPPLYKRLPLALWHLLFCSRK
jgi:glycosyltransferase involved in cell wall biosynthesis